MFKNVFRSGIRGTYSVSENPAFQTDSWVVYPANHRQSNKLVSVFIFDKYNFENAVNRLCSQSPNTKSPKAIIQECYEILRNEVSCLARLRHPQLLTVIEPLEETKLKLIFATEPVVANLQTYDFTKSDQVSIQKGLLEVSKGLQFLHNMCSMVHLNLQPNSIFVNDQGDWKIAGFKFIRSIQDSTPDSEGFFIMNSSSLVPFANLDLDFVAPELVVGTSQGHVSLANDIWSLGQLLFYVFNKGDTLINCFDKNSVPDYKAQLRKFEQKFYNHRPAELRYLLKETPESLYTTLTLLLARQPHDRISIDEFVDSEYFNGSLIKTMWFADEFSTKGADDKLLFLDGLLEENGVFTQLPTTFKNSKLLALLIHTILTELNLISAKQYKEKNDILVSKALLISLKIGADLLKLSFQDRIYESLLSDKKPRKNEKSPLSLLSGCSVRVRLALVEQMDVLVSKLLDKQISIVGKVLTPLCLTYQKSDLNDEGDQVKLQDSILHALQKLVDLFDFPYIKNDLLPLLCQVFKTTSILSTKTQSIETFKILIQKRLFDEKMIVDTILPIFENVKSRDQRIVSPMLDFYVDLCNNKHLNFDLETLVNSVLVQCIKLAFGCQGCDKSSFNEFLTSINSIQQSLIDVKSSQLNSKMDSPKADDFSSLINSALIKNGSKSDVEKNSSFTPMHPTQDFSKPMNKSLSDSLNAQTKASKPQINKSAPLTLKPGISTSRGPKEPETLERFPPGFSTNLLTPQLNTQTTEVGLRDPSDLLDLL